MSLHEELQRSLGSYVLGALEPSERAELEAHLAGCAACAQELAAYAGLPGLLSRVPLDEVEQAPAPPPPPTVLPRLLAAAEREQRGSARRLRRWQVGAGAVAAVAAVAVGVTVVPAPLGSDDGDRELVVSRTTSSGPVVSGTVELDARPWGTSVRLRLEDLPQASSYTAWATDDAGRRTAVATWGTSPSGDVDVTGATSLPVERVRSVQVSAEGRGEVLTFSDDAQP